ncbi:spindle and kinetochore-associated protein 1 isoform X2 [Anser cygnoides]|uniref:spindle and kinetochore-associated protein 1 isoform X2 n=1 Tax=Anser cygnoides TaxID=8845 RepID=UPI000670A37A|nr:spindle and kinetochore-associated protein 1 isoform X2 [Anser cygnoides]
MASSDLEDLCFHINMKISTIKKTLQLRSIGQEPSFKSMLCKIGHEMVLLHDLLNKMEMEVQQQEKLKNLLKELQKSAERDQSEAQHLRENIPLHLPKPTQSWYMKGRLTYDQINAVVQDINKAVVSKYKILHQPLKSMNASVRSLYHRFLEEETKDTKGEFFVVEADIKEFTQLKADKRFHRILNILRHCQRVREVRGSRLVRYVIC